MSIIENALHRAKGQMEPLAEPRAEPRVRKGATRERRPAQPPPAHARTYAPPGDAGPAAADADSRTTVGFPEVPYDPQVCATNRVVVHGADKHAAAQGAASYRTLRTRLLQQMRTNNWDSVAITSPGASEGKTLTTVNLALSMARERNSDVFLLDLDMRKPNVCSCLGVAPPHDIVRFFTGEIEAHDVFFSIGVQYLAIAASIIGSDNSSELLANGRLPELLTYIRSLSSNALIVVDLPPVINTDDALVVAPMVDMLLLMATEGKTRRDALQRTLDLLAEFNVGGLILNRSHDTFGKNYYSY